MAIKESYENALRKAIATGPYYQLLGISLEKLDNGFARFRMPFKEGLLQVNGVIHGGAIASLADTAVAFALMTMIQPGEKVTTVEFKINYLAPAEEGDLFGEAQVVSKGRRIAVADMEVKNGEGKRIAKGMATYMILSPRKPMEE
ncbi:MAG: PaaI family thioesterase [Deltaproteobacteria bacterium]|nr:PaaI family thioesterase [Deltaproteobacteria bacterium]